MNWAGDNSLRQSNSVIFLFAAYNLIVSQGRQLTQGPFSNDFPTISHMLRNYFSVFTCKLTLFDNERCHFNSSAGCHSCARTYLPGDFVSYMTMLNSNWKVSSVIKLAKSCAFCWSLFY